MIILGYFLFFINQVLYNIFLLVMAHFVDNYNSVDVQYHLCLICVVQIIKNKKNILTCDDLLLYIIWGSVWVAKWIVLPTLDHKVSCSSGG